MTKGAFSIFRDRKTLLIGFLCFLLYGNTLTHDYALDDFVVITQNRYTQEGLKGIWDILSKDTFAGHYGDKKQISGGRYRPLSVVSFAIEKEVFGNKPEISHLINLLLYALTGVILFKVLENMLKSRCQEAAYLSIPFIATIIFLIHPVHTEVVANIKGRDEILALLFSLLTLFFILVKNDHPSMKYRVAVFAAFFLALFSKENAIAFVLVVPLSLFFFKGCSGKELLCWMTPMVAAAGLYLMIRSMVVPPGLVEHSLLDDPYKLADLHQKYATIAYILGVYLKLLAFPHPLTWDYYPFHIEYHRLSSWPVVASALAYAGLLAMAIGGFKKKGLVSYAIFLYLVPLALVSNLFFNVGTFMAERFLYFPSLGVAIGAGYFISTGLSKMRKIQRSVFIVTLILAAGVLSAKTIDRNRAWKDEYTLYETDLAVSANSAKSNIIVGNHYSKLAPLQHNPQQKTALYEKALRLTEKALEIYPDFIQAKFILANIAWDYQKDYKRTYRLYLDILDSRPDEEAVYQYAFKLLPAIKDDPFKMDLLNAMYAIDPKRPEITYNLGLMHGRNNDADQAADFFDQTLALSPDHADALKFRGIIHYQNEDYDEALRLLLDADEIKGGKDNVLIGYIANTYVKLGDVENQNKYLKIFKSN